MIDYKLSGKRALITGGSRGIGRAIALDLASHGCDICISARDSDSLGKTTDEIRSMGVSCFNVAANLDNSYGVMDVFTAIDKEWGTLDILVNNVGSGETQPSIPSQDGGDFLYQSSFNLNALACVRMTNHFIPYMLTKKWGRVIAVASKQGREAGGRAWYTMAKAAEIAYMKTMSCDFNLARSGITFNTIAPGAVVTETGAWGSFKAKDPVAFDERVKAKFPMGRAGKPEEIAPLVSFLCSEYTSFISGACIPVDGGESYSF